MIITYLIVGIMAVFTGLFALIPNLPDMPQEIINAGEQLMYMIQVPVGLLQLFLSPVLLTLIVTLTLALMNFRLAYHVVMFVLKKMHVVN